jgi:superfamily II DNA helicase RecQ
VRIDEARATARDRLGIERLKPGQEEALASVFEGQDTLVVMPSGAGKSAIYQVAGLLIPGTTVVVSPILALQRDQLASIEEHAAGGGAQINSDLTEARRAEAFREIRREGIEFVFLARSSSTGRTRWRRSARSACSSSTRRTASANGGTTSGPTTCGSEPSSGRSATRRCSR